MQIYLLLTQNCNLSCSFCIRGKSHDIDMDINTWKTILEKNDFSKYQLLLTGGEPTLYNKFNEVIDISYNKFKHISINTNGINDKWIDNLKHKDIHVQISLDGTKDVHNQLRLGNNYDIFDKIEKTIYKLEDIDIKYNISTTVSKDNYDNIKHLMQYITKFKKMKYWKLSPQLPFGCGSFENAIDVDKWNELVEYLLDNSNVKLNVKKLFCFELLDKFIDENKDKVINISSNCGSAKTKFYIYPNFTVYPCTCLTDFPIGNLKSNTLEEIKEFDISKIFSNYKVLDDSDCSKCKYLKLCNGGCIGMSYHYFKKIGMGDYRCPLINKTKI